MSQQQSLIAGRYRLEELIGRGGMGDVYRGADTHEDELVAVKLLHPNIVDDNPDIVDRFTREGEALRRLNHPNIVTIRDAVTEFGRHYLVMEYVSGGSLRDLLDEHARLPIEGVLNVALDLADALTRAHRLNIIHRDIKPDNVLLAEDGTPRLTDFGVAHLGDRTRLTQTGSVIGTYAYLSPEACNGLELDERADIWSFGVMLFEMLAGRVPFIENGTAAILTAIMTKPAPDLRRLRPGTPDPLLDLIYRMLEKDRDRRIGSVRLVGAELEAIIRTLDTPLRQKVAEAGHNVTIGSRFATPPDTDSDISQSGSDVPAMERHEAGHAHGLSLYPTPSGGASPPVMTPGGTPMSTSEIAQANTRKWQLIALMVIVTVLACSTVALTAILFGPVRNDDRSDSPEMPPLLPTVEPVRTDEVMVLVAELEPIDTDPRDITRFIVDNLELTLEESVPFSQIGVRQYPTIITNGSEARAAAEATGATVLVWGNYTDERTDLHVQIGVTDAFTTLRLPLDSVEQVTDVRVSLDDPRAESIAPYVLGVLGGLHGAVGDVYAFMRTLAVIEEIDVTPAHIMGDSVAAYTHSFFQLYTDDTSGALTAIDGAIEKDPTNPFSYALRSIALQRQERYAAGQDAAETAARLGGDDWTIPLVLLASSTSDPDESIRYFSDIIAINPDDWYALSARGTLYYLLGDADQSRADLDASIALEPNTNIPYVFAALQALYDGRLDDAAAYVDTIITDYPDPDLYRRVIGATMGESGGFGTLIATFVNLVVGRYETAVEMADGGAAIVDEIPDLRMLQGIAYCHLGRAEQAEDAYSAALDVAATSELFVQRRALLYLLRSEVRRAQGDTTGAEDDIASASEIGAASPALIDGFAEGTLGCERLFDRAELVQSDITRTLVRSLSSSPRSGSRTTAAEIDPLDAIEPVSVGQYMVLVADMEPIGVVTERDVARFIVDDLTRQFVSSTYDNVAVRHYPATIGTANEATRIAIETGATVIVWGNYSQDVIALDVQAGSLDVFPYIPFQRETITTLTDVRVHLTNERRESVAMPVLNVLNLLALADGDEFEWMGVMLLSDTLDVRSGEPQGTGAAAYTHRAIADFGTTTDLALAAFDSALTRASGNPLLYVFRGLSHLRLGNTDLAQSDFETATRLGPDTWAMPVYLTLDFAGTEQSLAVLEQLKTLRPDDWYADFLEAMVYYDALSQLDEAQAALERSFNDGPEANLPYIVGLVTALREGDISQAQTYANTVLTAFPDPELTNRAFQAVYGGNDPNELTGLYFESITNLVLGQYGPIVADVGPALDALFDSSVVPGQLGEQYNGLSDLFLVQGVAECNLNNYAAAEEAYSQAIRFSRIYALPYMLRAQMQRAQADSGGAANDFAAARDRAPAALDAWIDEAESGAWNCRNLLDYTLPER